MKDLFPHPSFFELDRLALSSDPAPSNPHLASCPECLAHVERLRQKLPPPRWLDAMAQPRPQPQESQWSIWAGGFAAAAFAALAAIHILSPTERHPPDPEIRAKGLPAVAVFIKHDASVKRWDGLGQVHPGDSLRLEVNPAHFKFVTVVAPAAQGTFQVLFRGPVPQGQPTLLPQSLRVDGSGGPERLRILLTDGPLADADLTSTTAASINLTIAKGG